MKRILITLTLLLSLSHASWAQSMALSLKEAQDIAMEQSYAMLNAEMDIAATRREVQEVLEIDVPVYVIFTKVDLIAGFRERFGRLTPQDRQVIWGHTFQTQDRHDATATRVGQAFDGLLGRLTDSTVTEVAMDPDGARRIAGFAFPTQMALLKPKAERFLASVFAGPARTTRRRAVLRGFYFASGTQEGTPFDQILGVLTHDRGADSPRGGVDGRHGKSYFLHDLLTRVVFAEKDWVSHDLHRSTLRRRLQRAGLAMVVAVTGVTMAGVAVSYWTSATLVAEAESAAAGYFAEARNALAEPVIADDDPRPVLAFLDSLRALPGVETPPERQWPRFGLDRHEVVAAATTQAYGDGMERLLRPRLMLSLEDMLLRDLAAGPAHPDPGAMFQRLMAYLHLSKHPASSSQGDAALLLVLTRHWRADGTDRSAAALWPHVQAMLALDDAGKAGVSADAALVADVRALLGNLPLAVQVVALLDIRAFADGVVDLVFVDDIGEAADLFRSTNGGALGAVFVPGLFTDSGARHMMPGAMGDAAEIWRAGRWVMGDGGVPASVVEQLAGLDDAVQQAYWHAAARAWASLFQTLALQPITPDARGVARLGRLGDPAASPLHEVALMVAAAPAGTPDPMLWQQFARSGLDAVTEAFGTLGQSMQTALQSPSVAAEAALSRDLARLTVAASGAPPALSRMVAATVATIRAPDPATAFADLQRAIEAELAEPCRADLAGRFPFAAPDAIEAVPVPVFAGYFGPGGRVETFIARHLAGHVVDAEGGLRPDLGGPIAARLDPGILGFVERAGTIRDAFFMNDGPVPAVAFALGLADAPPDVAQVVVTMQGTTVVLRPGEDAVPFVWNGALAGLSIELLDPQGAFLGGFESERDGWDVGRWLGSALRTSDETTVELRTEIAGRMLGIHAVFERPPASFGMTALREWRCPRALE